MATKKDFTKIQTGKVAANIETATSKRGQQGTVTPEEASARASELRTQGRKGCKATRINMAFTPENHEYIKIMARISGQTMTEYANFVIAKYREEHPEIYKEALKIISKF